MSVSHFDDIATAYDASLPSHVVEHYLRKREAFLAGVCPPGSMLDVGCGTGLLAERMSARGYRVTGVDPSEGMLTVLQARSPQIETARAPGSALPFPGESFDLVVSVATMHHIAAPEEVRRTLAEMIRVCRPGGRVIVWDHNPRNPYWSSLMARVPQDTGEERLIPAQEITAGLQAGGGQVLSVSQLGAVPDFTPVWAIRPAAFLERTFEGLPYVSRLAAHNVIVARPA